MKFLAKANELKKVNSTEKMQTKSTALICIKVELLKATQSVYFE